MISISGIPISDKIVILFEDITGRKRIEENLLKSEQQYKLISEITSDYVFRLAIDPQGKIRLSRQAVLEGWTAEEAKMRDRPGPRRSGGPGDSRGGSRDRRDDRRGGSSRDRDRRR